MLTKEQEEKIRKAIYDNFKAGSIMENFYNAIIAALNAYDEQVNGVVKLSKNSNVVVFRPCFMEAEVYIFHSEEEMLEKLTEKYACKIGIGEETIPDDVLGWKHCQRVIKVNNESKISEVIGYCDCKTFKRGLQV